MIAFFKSALKKTPLYPHYYAHKQLASINSWTAEDSQRADFYRQFVSRGDLVFDVGANLGNRLKVFIYLGCKSIAIEPQKLCSAALKLAFSNQATILRCALSHQSGIAELRSAGTHLATLSPGFISKTCERFRGADWDEIERVPTRTMDDLIAEYGVPRFIKIDVEGHESAVLSGLSRRVPAMSFEFHPELLDDTLRCLSRLKSLGGHEFNFSYGESMDLAFHRWLGFREIEEILRHEKEHRGDVYARSV